MNRQVRRGAHPVLVVSVAVALVAEVAEAAAHGQVAVDAAGPDEPPVGLDAYRLAVVARLVVEAEGEGDAGPRQDGAGVAGVRANDVSRRDEDDDGRGPAALELDARGEPRGELPVEPHHGLVLPRARLEELGGDVAPDGHEEAAEVAELLDAQVLLGPAEALVEGVEGRRQGRLDVAQALDGRAGAGLVEVEVGLPGLLVLEDGGEPLAAVVAGKVSACSVDKREGAGEVVSRLVREGNFACFHYAPP